MIMINELLIMIEIIFIMKVMVTKSKWIAKIIMLLQFHVAIKAIKILLITVIVIIITIVI